MPKNTPKRSPKTKAQRIGDRGETRIANALKTEWESQYILSNIILQNGDSTSQIDHIAVTQQGVFVIEVKNFHANKVTCPLKDKYWYYMAYDGKTLKKYTFYNPLWQNATHTNLIKDILSDSVPIYSVVTFALNNPLEFIGGTKPKNVLSIYELIPYIKAFPECLPEDLRNNIVETIKRHHLSNVTIEEHIQSISKFI